MFPTRRITLGGDSFRDEYSLAFDGTDDYIGCGTGLTDITSGGFTIGGWYQFATVSETHCLFARGDGSDEGYKLEYQYNGGSQRFLSTQTKTGGRNYNSYSIVLDINRWYHVLWVNGGTGSESALYLDNVKVVSNTHSEDILTASSEVFDMSRVVTANYLEGKISDVVFYNIALTASQVATIYNGREPYNHKEGVASSNLAGWWRMGDGSIDKFNLVGDEVNATLGSDLITDGGFDGDGSAWTVDNFSIGSGVATTSTNGASIQQSLSISTGDMIKIVAEIKNYTSGSIRYYTGAGTDVSRSFSSDGVHTHYLIANSTKVLFYSDNFNGSIDNVKVYKVNGNAGAMINMASDDFTGDTP